MSVDVRQWDGGEYFVATQGRGGRRHAPKGPLNKAGYPEPEKIPIMGVDELAVESAADAMRPNSAAPGADSQAQILFDTRNSRYDRPRELVLVVKLTPNYAVSWRALIDHGTGGQRSVDGVFTSLRSGPDSDFRTAQFIFQQVGYSLAEAEKLATAFSPTAPAGSFFPLKEAAMQMLGKSVDLLAVLGPEGAQAYEEQRAGLDILADLDLEA